MSIVYFSSGESSYDYFFLRKLYRKFSNIVFLSYNPKPKYVPTYVYKYIIPEPIHKLPARDSFRFYSILPFRVLLLRHTLRKLEPRILIGCGGLDYGLISAFSNYHPFVIFVWGSDVLVWPKFFLFRALIKYSLAKADLIVVDSYVQLRECMNLGCNKDKIFMIPWVDYNEIEKLSKNVINEKDIFRRKFGWGENDPVIVCTRSHEKIYNIETIIQAIPVVLKHFPNARFLFIGKGTLTGRLKHMAYSLGVSRNVSFTGFIPHRKIFYYLRNSDIYVSSSLSDGTSASLIEAMSCGLPCIVSNIPGNAEWIKNYENGLLFSKRDSEDLAHKIIMLLYNPELSQKLGRAARCTVKEKADWKKRANGFYKALEKLLK